MRTVFTLLTVVISLLGAGVHGSFDVQRDIRFELHTRSLGSPETFVVLTSGGSNVPSVGANASSSGAFDARRPTRIFVHGFKTNALWFRRYARAFLKNDDCNFIAVNWLNGSQSFNYLGARGRVGLVGTAVADLIDGLVNRHGLQLDDRLLVVGHSLGAHIVGMAGQLLQQRSGRKLPLIVGLDPAYPLFRRNNADGRLSRDDAAYVQVIHTNGGHLGISYPVGDADFYTNWGRDQPGCSGTKKYVCSHGRSHKLFIESLSGTSVFLAQPCRSYEELNDQRRCTGDGPPAAMGTANAATLRRAVGLYNVLTNAQAPYAINSTGVLDEAFIVV